MIYVLAIVVALQLAAGQALWKVGVQHAKFQLSVRYILSKQIFGLILSPYVIVGMAIYVFATVVYMGMLAKYQYSTVQGIIVALSLTFAFVIAAFIFHDRITSINVAGLAALLVGILLLTHH